MSPKEKLFFKHFGVSILFYVMVLFIAMSSADSQAEKNSDLRNTGVDATAHITSTECSSHGKFNYEYSSIERKVTGYGNSNNCNLACQDIKVGDNLNIKFLPNEPNVNACEFQVNQTDDPSSPLFMFIALAIVIFFLASISYMQGLEKINSGPEDK